jgi:outer membrane protein TolC
MHWKLILMIAIVLQSSFYALQVQAITLDEIKTLAVQHSGSLAAHELEVRALHSEAKIKGKWQNPQVLGQFGTLKSGDIRGATTEISFTQPVPLSNKVSLRKEFAVLAAKEQEAQTNFYRNWVAHQAVISAWRVYANSELLKHGQERTKRLNLVKRYMGTRPRVTIRHRVEISLIGSLLLQLERDLDEKKHQLSLSLSDLEFWTGKKISPSELKFSIPEYGKLSVPSLSRSENDPELRKAALSAKMSSVDEEIAAKERRPDLFLGAGYRVENVTPVNHFSYAIVGLNIPIWDSGSSRLETARARALRDEKLLADARNRIAVKHKKQIEEVRFRLEQVKRFSPVIIRNTDHAIHEAENGFKQGVLDVNTFMQTETQSHEVIDQVYFSWMDYLESLSDLALMKGDELKWETL